MSPVRRALAAACALLAGLSLTALAVTPASGRTAAPADCSGQFKVDRTLPNGARWQVCWDVHAEHGLRVTRARYTPKGGTTINVLQSLALAQVHVPYDSGHDFQDMPFNIDMAVKLTAKDCPGGELRSQGRPVTCVRTAERGHGYKKADEVNDIDRHKQRQAKEIVLSSVFIVGWYNYVVEYRFADDGEITPRLGATGSLAETGSDDDGYLRPPRGPKYGWPVGPGNTRYAESHSHNAFWRIDFGLQGNGNKVEQYDFSGTGTRKRELKRAVLQRETSAKLSSMRFWRVLAPNLKNADRHPVSWQLGGDVASTQYRGPDKFTQADVYVTQYKACEKLAAGNAEDGGCKTAVNEYLNGQTLTHPIVWLSVDFHHVPRDEDQDPMPSHWQGFTLSPRDATATNPY